MPGNTPVHQLPYPLPTDPVRDGDDTIRQLAEKLDLLPVPQDTGWRDISALLENGWAATVSGGVAVRRVGSTVSLRVRGLSGAASTANTFWTPATAWLPAAQSGGLVSAGNGVTLARVLATTTALSLWTANRATFVGDAAECSWLVPPGRAWPSPLPGTATT